MRLRAVAEQDDIAHQHRQGIYAETEMLPTLVVHEEQHRQYRQHRNLHQSVIRQQ